MKRFEAHMSRLMFGYTVIVLGVLATTAAFMLVLGRQEAAGPFALVLAGLLLVGLFSVRYFELDRGELLIRRPLWTTRISLRGLVEATAAEKLVRSSISLWSTRGLYGFIGYGYSAAVGTYRAYVTNSAKAVLLRFESGKIVVVSPDSPNEFLSAVSSEIVAGSAE